MNEGDVLLARLPQSDGQIKNRPVIALRRFPPFGDILVCGVSSQTHLAVVQFDELIETGDADFKMSGLKSASVIRLGFLATLPTGSFLGRIGLIAPTRHRRLVARLADYIADKS